MEDKRQRFTVHVYHVTLQHEEYFFTDLAEAKRFANKEFKLASVYKVKIWDLEKGPIEPNKWNAIALVYELV